MPPPVPERTAAKTAGERFYFVSRPCRNGHHGKRWVRNGRCVECEIAAHKRWHIARPGLEAKWARDRRAKDPTGHRAEAKRWYWKNRDYALQKMKEWREANPERKREMMRAWVNANRDAVRLRNREAMRVRRGLKGPNGGSYTADDIEHIRTKQNQRCAGCQYPDQELQIDHIVAIVKGGTNDPSNIQLLCEYCNKSKRDRDFNEWLILKGFFS